jgi:hypothetical protein
MIVIPGAASEKFHLTIKEQLGIINGLLIIPPWFICQVEDGAPPQANISLAWRMSWAMANLCGQACSARE